MEHLHRIQSLTNVPIPLLGPPRHALLPANRKIAGRNLLVRLTKLVQVLKHLPIIPLVPLRIKPLPLSKVALKDI